MFEKQKINYHLLLRRVCLIILDIILTVIASVVALATRFEFDFRGFYGSTKYFLF